MRLLPFPSWSARLLGLAVLASTAAQAAPLSLLDDRFSVEATWRTADGQTGSGTPVSLTPETGYFWFFSPTNTEAVVKVLDACSGPNQRFWVFAGGLTDTEVTLTVTDEANGAKKVYRNPPGTPFAPIQDTGAFATCAAEHCGQGRFADLAASPRAEPELEGLAAEMSDTIAAPQAVYERVVADVTAIRTANPGLRDVTFAPGYELRSIQLEVDGAATTAIAGGQYTAWDCLNRRYGLQQVTQPAPGHILLLRFSKVLDISRLLEDYETLPGVLAVEPIWNYPPFPIPILPPPLPPQDTFCGRIEGDLHKYYVRFGGGEVSIYTSLPGAAPTLVGTPPAPWFADAQGCFDEQSSFPED
jgi:hypothetical protein